MAKELRFNMSYDILEFAKKPLRDKENSVLLLLNTLRMIDSSAFITATRDEKVIIYIDKMSRVFYILKDKIFSMQFPFHIEKNGESNGYVYSCHHTYIDQTVLSLLIRIFNYLVNKHTSDFENAFNDFIDATDNCTIELDVAWDLTHYLLSYDLGYLRYDYDEEHFKTDREDLHPLHHLDVFLDPGATFKIGLKKSIPYSEFRNILDTTSNCLYLQ